ncbi:tripartite motif-containing protein 42 [Python bivittatus]|uniref:Tripartite motif-containing protein 42 n=1 Tax=Python bivittatus TaxID=176946 RepID=A0A9F5MQY9_PYTBI|nr:tripartite motif-containing protein 42 [Python bivittatus]
MSGRACACCMTCPCCPGCNCCKKCLKICGPKQSSLCWQFMFTDERNCDCCYCPHEDDTTCQCCHCACSESPNCRWCCCSCANNRNCKCLCCTEDNNECQCYESRCCTFPYLPYRRGAKLRRSRGTSNTSVISLDKEPSGHAFIDQLVCPLCQRMFIRPFMLPCNHCICDRCIMQSRLNAEITESFYVLTCPICKRAHCLPFSKRMYLRINYLRARLARKYMRRYGFLRWRFDKSYVPIYCQVCDEQKASKRCLSCQLNYCNVCLRNCHQEISSQNHAYAKITDDIWEDKNCLIHGDSLLSKYCLDDHELICEYCAETQHSDHNKVSLAIGCSRMSAALFAAIAKFKKVRYVVDNDLMEVLVLKSNFKSYKETKRREIRNGFMRLRMILQEREKELMEAVENLEIEKQKALYEFANHATRKIDQMDSLMQYSKEALKEESPIAFLQSARCLVKEIEDIIASVYQPNPHLKEDPIKHLKVNFEELSENLVSIFPSLHSKLRYEKMNKCPYPCSSDVMIPRTVSSAQIPNPLGLNRSFSLSSFHSLYDQTFMNNELSTRPKSSPPMELKGNQLYAIWNASSDTSKDTRNYPDYGVNYNPELQEETSSAPGLVVVYQTLVYPTVAKIYWTCPTEDVDSFEVAYYEVLDEEAPENLIQSQLIGVLTGIVQQNLEIHNLSPNTEYLFKVRAVNENGPGEWSEVCKVMTPDVRSRVKARWGLLRNVQSAFRK